MEWISVKEGLPGPLGKGDSSIYVWVTDGHVIEIGQYVFKPRSYGCAIDDDEMEATCGPPPHWHIETKVAAFKGGDKSFSVVETENITHWMPLPDAPKGGMIWNG